MDLTIDYAIQQDKQDPLRQFRNRFHIPMRNGKEQIYFLGNSLGLQPISTQSHISKVLEQWAMYGVEGFFESDTPWYSMHERLAGPMSKIVGALPSEVVVMNHLTVNLHLLFASFYRPAGSRYKILCEAKAFPSDQYMLESLCRYLNLDPAKTLLEIEPAQDEHNLTTSAITAAIEKHADELALVFLGGVNYYSGEVLDMAAITRVAKKSGIMVGFDLAHAAGNIPLELHSWDIDFAAWCNYKYLNAGPGAVAAAFIHERYHTDQNLNRLAGWWGYEKSTRFKMQKGFVPVPTAEGWAVSTPPILQYAALEASLELFQEAGFENIYAKGNSMSTYLLQLLNELNSRITNSPIEILTPQEPDRHGCQVSMLMRERGRQAFEALSENEIFADWREPNVIRIAPVPLYNRYEEIWLFVQVMEQVLQQDN
jgi:kynureninase